MRWIIYDPDSFTGADTHATDIEDAMRRFLGANPIQSGSRVVVVQRPDLRKRRYQVSFTRDAKGSVCDLVIAAVDRDWCLDEPVTAANV